MLAQIRLLRQHRLRGLTTLFSDNLMDQVDRQKEMYDEKKSPHPTHYGNMGCGAYKPGI